MAVVVNSTGAEEKILFFDVLFHSSRDLFSHESAKISHAQNMWNKRNTCEPMETDVDF